MLVLAIVLSLFGARLVQLQGLDARTYAAEAEQGRLRTALLPAVRGTITDRNGVALATTVDAVNITADQTLISEFSDPAATARVLSPVLGIEVAALQARLTGERRFAYVAKKVSPETWRAVRDLDLPDESIEGLPGIFGERTSKRVYPAGTTAANLVGFVGADGKGLGGLEYAMDDVLSGRDGHATYELSAGGRRIPSGVDSERQAVAGRDVTLTIDRDIQFVAQKAIAKAVASTSSQSGTVIVLDPRSGELLAVATAPTFDANKPGASRAADRGNRPLTEPYEPGSTGKVLTAAALLEEGVVTPRTPITVPNRLSRAGKSFKDFEDHPTQYLTYAGTMAKSSNIGTIRAAERLGNLKRLHPYLEKFGIGTADRAGAPRRGRRVAARPGRLVGDQRLHDDLRPGLLGQHRPDGLGDRGRRARRRAPEPAARAVDDDRRRQGRRTRRAGPDAGRERVHRRDRARDDGDGHTQGRHGPAGRHPRLPRGRQDGHRAALRPVLRLLQRLHDVLHRARPGRRPGARGRGDAAGAEVEPSAAA